MAEAESMVAASQKADKHLYYAEDWMFAPALIRAQEIIAQGQLAMCYLLKPRKPIMAPILPLPKKSVIVVADA